MPTQFLWLCVLPSVGVRRVGWGVRCDKMAIRCGAAGPWRVSIHLIGGLRCVDGSSLFNVHIRLSQRSALIWRVERHWQITRPRHLPSKADVHRARRHTVQRFPRTVTAPPGDRTGPSHFCVLAKRPRRYCERAAAWNQERGERDEHAALHMHPTALAEIL